MSRLRCGFEACNADANLWYRAKTDTIAASAVSIRCRPHREPGFSTEVVSGNLDRHPFLIIENMKRAGISDADLLNFLRQAASLER
jgi:hypothetical protein